MKIIKNFITLTLFFLVFFIIYFGIYLFKVMDTNNIYQNMNIDLVKNLMEHYFLAIVIVASISSVVIIGALNKFSGGLPTIIVIGILAFFITLYPAYTVAFDKNIDYLRNELNDKTSLFIDDTGRYFTRVDNYLIKVGYKLLDNTYKNVILVDPTVMGKLYIGDYIYITDKEISLHEVKEINSGCICCTIKGDFKQNILDIISNYRPDRIIIEPSGVANFSQVLESIKEDHIEGLRINMKITMVDAQNVHMYMKNFGDFYRSQLINANTIILTRVEKLSDNEITHVCNEIKTINNKYYNSYKYNDTYYNTCNFSSI